MLAQCQTPVERTNSDFCIPDVDIPEGQRVDDFTILSRYGTGGMGVVFKAWDEKLLRNVALKFVRCDGNEDRILKEARAIARLNHKNVVTIYAVGRYRDQLYLAMELVEGSNMSEWIRKWNPSKQEVFRRYQQAGEALASAHASGVVHHDFKPHNILVGDDARVRVSDFGLARFSRTEQSVISSGGTPRYMAPEQKFGHLGDSKSDQYSFCISLHESLWGQHPDAGNAMIPPGWQRRVASVIKKGLSEAPSQRYPNMTRLLVALQNAATSRRKRQPSRWLLASVFLATFAYAGVITLEKRKADLRIVSLEADLAEFERSTAIKQVNPEVLGGPSVNAVLQSPPALTAVASSQAKQPGKFPTKAVEETALSSTGDAVGAKNDNAVESQAANREKMGNGSSRLKTRTNRLSKRIAKSIRRDFSDTRKCISEWQARHPTRELAFKLELALSSDGKPTQVAAFDTQDIVLAVCIEGALSRVRFPTHSKSSISEVDINGMGEEIAVAVRYLTVAPDLVE